MKEFRNGQEAHRVIYLAKPGGDQRSSKTDAHADLIMAMLDEHGDITLAEIQSTLLGKACPSGSAPSGGSLILAASRANKDRHAIEQDRPDILSQRRAWSDGQLDLEPEHPVFVDETKISTNMTRSHGRCAKGERLRMDFPRGHCKTNAPTTSGPADMIQHDRKTL